METRQDFYVGLLIVVAIALVVGALIATSGWGERRYDLYLRVADAEGISPDTKALVQGLEVGRVRSVSPAVDSMRQATQTLARVQSTVRDVAPDVESTLDNVAAAMGRVDSLVERLQRAGLGDSIAATVAGANRLLGRLDSLAGAAQSLTVENRVDLRETVTNLTELSRQLNHFVDELSRRPYRVLTGVKPLSRDTTRHDTTRVSVKP